MDDSDLWEGQPYSHLHTTFLATSVITYVGDIVLDVILAVTFFSKSEILYGLMSISMVIFPTLLVQIFSVRWYQIDNAMNKALWIIHGATLGIAYRYLEVISLGYEARKLKSKDAYTRYHQQERDVVMLRLFDSFLESAPQLVFHLYIWLVKEKLWPTELIVWTAMSALASMVSLGWGIAAYSSTMRITLSKKENLSLLGMILQTIWRSGMLSARIIALVLLALYLKEWVIIVMFMHWFVMTLWVVYQNTDFCNNIWEERLYNAIVGVIYCFCFFNLKEGRSRSRAVIFYTVIVLENFAFVTLFYLDGHFQDERTHEILGMGGLTIVFLGTLLGLAAMLLYYRYFHPAGPISLCSEAKDLDDKEKSVNVSSGPDFEIQDYATVEQRPSNPPRPLRRKMVQHSRSFKDACPPSNRHTPKSSNNGQSPSISPVYSVKLNRALDSAYGTDSNRTVSRNTASPKEDQTDGTPNRSGSSSTAFNNETYMSVEREDVKEKSFHSSQAELNKSGGVGDERSEVSQCSQLSSDSRVTVIDKYHLQKRTPTKENQPEKLLKRSPVLKDVTSAKVENENKDAKDSVKKGDALTAPLTIIIPNISHQAFVRTKTTPTKAEEASEKKLLAHDYENLALVNINRGTLGVTHWRTYSDMANGKHDESTAYERKRTMASYSDYSNYNSLQYYDIYPLSREMKEQLYRSLTPVSTAATVASDSVNNLTDSSDTYEPIEVYNPEAFETEASQDDSKKQNSSAALPLTLIHHDGQSMMTKQIVSLENLREVLNNHEIFPMDDAEERGDLYLLAPMRILTPILEETESEITRHTADNSSVYQNLNKDKRDVKSSLLNVISEILSNSVISNDNYNDCAYKSVTKNNEKTNMCPDGRFPESSDTTSSLVHTIDEIRNSSLCNLFLSSSVSELNPCASVTSALESEESAVPYAAPQVPPRNPPENITAVNATEEQSSPVKDDNNVPCPDSGEKKIETEVPSLPKKRIKTPLLSSSVGSRKNILELGGGEDENLLNTPKRPSRPMSMMLLPANNTSTPKLNTSTTFPSFGSLHNISGHQQDSLHSVRGHSMPLSPSSKYETPTPPLRPNQFVRNSAINRPRRKFSVIREKFEGQPSLRVSSENTNVDLYQNISDDLLFNEVSQISQGSPSTSRFIDSRDFGLQPDDKYENLQRGWATSSIRDSHTALVNAQRNLVNRRSMSHIEGGKENHQPQPPPPNLGPKPSSSSSSRLDKSKTLAPGVLYQHHRTSLSPNSAIFHLRH